MNGTVIHCKAGFHLILKINNKFAINIQIITRQIWQ